MSILTSRLARFAVLPAALISITALTGCDRTPKAVGSQSATGYGSSGLAVDLQGPGRLEGDIKQPEGMQFPIKLKISGPPNGAARVTAVRPPLVDGCDLIKNIPMYIELDASGNAEAEGTMLFASDFACTFGFNVVSASEFKPDSRHYEFYGATDEADVEMTFRRVVDPASPEAISYTAREDCEGFVRDKLGDIGYVESFTWSPASVRNMEGDRYQAEGSFFVNNVIFNHRCTMDFNKTTGWTLVDLEVPGLESYRSEMAGYGG